jgi:pyrroline-5-carboxylate reductase
MQLLLVGGGNMGTALFTGWLQISSAIQVTVVDPHPSESLQSICLPPHKLFKAITDVPQGQSFDIILLAVKPQSFDDVLPQLVRLVGEHSVILSIAAGKTIATIQQSLPTVPVIRAMPNTPALIGQGMTVCVSSDTVSEKQKAEATQLLQAVGDVIWIDDEALMHAVTALSGSGPAYVFAMIEALQQAGEVNGLPTGLALQLALKTMQGAACLAQQSDKSAAELRQQVTSPGGTTEAALKVLQAENGLDELMEMAVAAATHRSKELN